MMTPEQLARLMLRLAEGVVQAHEDGISGWDGWLYGLHDATGEIIEARKKARVAPVTPGEPWDTLPSPPPLPPLKLEDL